jgi:hypothetical protein
MKKTILATACVLALSGSLAFAHNGPMNNGSQMQQGNTTSGMSSRWRVGNDDHRRS